MKYILLLVLFTMSYSADCTYGGYRNYDEFSAGKPSVPPLWELHEVFPPSADKGRYAEIAHKDTLTGISRKWKRSDGKLWAYCNSGEFYLNYRGVFSKASVAGDTAWFYGVEETSGADFNTGLEDTEWHEVFLMLDLKKNRPIYLNQRKVRKLISSNSELLNEYEQEEDKRAVMSEYMERYFRGDK